MEYSDQTKPKADENKTRIGQTGTQGHVAIGPKCQDNSALLKLSDFEKTVGSSTANAIEEY